MRALPIDCNDVLLAKDRLDYDSESGFFNWKNIKRGPVKNGYIAGRTKKDDGYTQIRIGVRTYYAHRLAWAFIHGSCPCQMEIDHINGKRSDNRICNLRLATRSQNEAHSDRPANFSGYRGVYWSGISNDWYVQVSHQGKRYSGGSFKCAHEAGDAAKNLRRKLHGKFARDN